MLGYITEFWKQSSEIIPRSHTWEHNLPDGTSIGSVTAKCYRLDTGVETSADMISGVTSSGFIEVFTVKAGSVGDYKITLTMIRSDSAKFEDDLLMHVKEL